MLKPSRLAALGDGFGEALSLSRCNGTPRGEHFGPNHVSSSENGFGVYQLMNGLTLREPATAQCHSPGHLEWRGDHSSLGHLEWRGAGHLEWRGGDIPEHLNWRGRKKLQLRNGFGVRNGFSATCGKDATHINTTHINATGMNAADVSAKAAKRRVGGYKPSDERNRTLNTRFCGSRSCILAFCLLASLVFNGVLIIMFMYS